LFFPGSSKKLEAISLNHDHVLHRVRELATMAQRGDGYYYCYYYYYYYGSTNPYLKPYNSYNNEEVPSLTFPNNQAQQSIEKRHHTFSRELPNVADSRSDILMANNVTITVLLDETLLRLVPVLRLRRQNSPPLPCECLTFLP
jgi:hypothetical protein